MEENQKAGPARKTTPSERFRVESKALASKLYFQGLSFQAISEAIKAELNRTVLAATISKWIRDIIAELKTDRPEMVLNFKFVELEKVNRLEITYWSAWNKSIGEQVMIRQIFEPLPVEPNKRGRKKKSTIHGKLKQTVKEVRTLTGEAKYLEGVRWCIEQRLRLLGLEGAAKNELVEAQEAIGKNLQEAAADIAPSGPRRIMFKVVGQKTGIGNVGG